MKILKKRCFAYAIDAFVYSSVLFLFHEFVYTPTEPLFNVILFCPFFLKDCLFRNASIGKKVMSIVVCDKCWNNPGPVLSIKRTVMTSIFGFLLLWKLIFIGGRKMILFEWEKNVLGTFVIDKKVYKTLKADAEKMEGDVSQSMTELYMMYLRDFYSK